MEDLGVKGEGMSAGGDVLLEGGAKTVGRREAETDPSLGCEEDTN